MARVSSRWTLASLALAVAFLLAMPLTSAQFIDSFLQIRTAGDFSINTTTLDLMTANQSRLYIAQDGSIGIGAADPQYLFQIATSPAGKDINLSNILFVNGSSGRVGIGTTTPGYDLHVSGSTSTTFALTTTNANSNVNLQLRGRGNTLQGTLSSGGSNNAVALTAQQADGYIVLQTGGSNERLRIDSAGNVGIGTTDPQYLLQTGNGSDGRDVNLSNTLFVNGSNGRVIIENKKYLYWFNGSREAEVRVLGLSNTNDILLGKDGNVNDIIIGGTTSYNKVGLGTSTPSHLLTLEEGPGGKSLNVSDALYVNGSSGKIGIGTSNPDQWLHVSAGSAGSVDAHPSSVITIENDGDAALNILTRSSDTGFLMFGDETDSYVAGLEYDHSSGLFTIQANDVDSLVIDSSGNVGIGNTIPNNTLDVSGNINVTGTDENSTFMGDVQIYGTLYGGSPLDVGGGLNLTSGNLTLSDGSYIIFPDGSQQTSASTFTNGSDINVRNLVANNTLYVNGSRVGIGTSAPDSSLTVIADSNNAIIARSPTSSRYSYFVSENANGAQSYFGTQRSGISDKTLIGNTAGGDVITLDGANVGIGTTSPNDALEVVGNVRVSGSLNASSINVTDFLLVSGNAVQTVEAVYNQDNFTLDYDARTDRFDNENFTTEYDLRSDRFGNGNFTTEYDSRSDRFDNENFTARYAAENTTAWNQSGSDIFLRDQEGNVGIGTTSPANTLEVAGNVSLQGNTSIGTNALFVDNTSGRVGLGDTSPEAALTITADDVGLQIEKTGVNSGKWTLGPGVGGVDAFVIREYGVGNRLAILEGGNIGIGNTIPNYTLDVSGNGTIRGNLNVTGTAYLNDLNVSGVSFTGGNIDTKNITADNIDLNENGSLYQPVYGSDDGLVLYLPFNSPNGSVQYDRSPYGNDGSIAGGVSCNETLGKYGTACSFDGSTGKIDIRRTPELNITNSSFTATHWIYFRDIPPSTIQTFGDSDGHANILGGWALGYRNLGNQLWFKLNNSHLQGGTFSPGRWYYVAGVYDFEGGVAELYIDGILVDSLDNPPLLNNTLLDLRVGAYSADPSVAWHFNGTIDEVMLYRRALAKEEIRTHYLRGSGYGASGAITANQFRVVNTSGSKQFEINESGASISPGGQERLKIDSSGNVGIGTSSPSDLLSVSSGITGDAVLRLEADTDNNGENDNAWVDLVQDGKLVNASLGLAGDGGSLTFNRGITDSNPNALVLNVIDSFAAADLQLATQDAVRMTITQDGNVGIGKTRPGELVELGTSTPEMRFNDTDNPNWWDIGAVGDDFKLYLNDSSSNGITIDQDGYVGIGTTNPDTGLEIYSDSGPSYGKIASSGDIAGIQLASDDSTPFWIFSPNNDDGLGFQSNGFSSPYIMYLATTGNVGIGNTIPNYTLDVSGDATVRGNLNVTGIAYLNDLNVSGVSFTGGNIDTKNITADNINLNENGSLYQPVYGTDDGLVLYLPFSRGNVSTSNQTVYDRSPYGHDGRCYGTDFVDGCNWTAGKYGNALYFDRTDDFVSVPHAVLSNEQTVEFWIKAMGSTGIPISSLKFTNPDHDGFTFSLSGGNLYFGIYTNSGANPSLSAPFSLHEWYHVVGTWSNASGEVNLYINGEQVASSSDFGHFDTIPTDLDIGRYNYQDNSYFKGIIDEVKVYKRAIAPEEVRTHYLRGSGYGASGAITANQFRVVNTSGSKQFEVNESGASISPGGQERLKIDSSGNVGVGTSSPSSKLAVHQGSDNNVIGQFFGADGGDYAGLGLNGVNAVITAGSTVTNDVNLVFHTSEGGSETERMRIDSSGNVGIGTDAPLSTLHVNGSGADGGLRVTNESGQTTFFANTSSGRIGIGTDDPKQLLEITGGSVKLNTAGSSYGWGSAGSASMGTRIQGNPDVGEVIIYASNSPVFYTRGGQNIGIGTTSPNHRLTVNGMTNTTGGLIANDTLFVNGSRVGIGTSSPRGTLEIDGGGSSLNLLLPNNGYLEWETSSGTTGSLGIYGTSNDILALYAGSSNALTVNSNGGITMGRGYDTLTPPTDGAIVESNMGVGTADPQARLHVNGSNSAELEALRLSNGARNGGQSVSIVFENDGGGDDTGKIESILTGDFNDGDLAFHTELDGTLYERLRIDSSGNVGIGTDNPTKKLSINGTLDAMTFDPSATTGPLVNTTGKNLTLTSATGSVIIRLGE